MENSNFKRIFRSRRESVASSADEGDQPLSRSNSVSVGGLDGARSSIDGAKDKVHRLSARIKTRRRNKDGDDADAARIDQQELPLERFPDLGSTNQSEDSLGLSKSIASSLLTEDSEDEGYV